MNLEKIDLTYKDLCRLSLLFNSCCDLQSLRDYKINEWLKYQLEYMNRKETTLVTEKYENS
jgi:hypothetical protein